MKPSVQTLGILAGGGDLPSLLASSCAEQGITSFVIGFEGQVDAQTDIQLKAKLGQVGKVIKALKDQGITDIVMIGSIERPSFSEVLPDLKGAKFLSRNALKVVGDSDLLSALRGFLEDEGFTLHGIQKFCPDLLTPHGILTKAKPSKGDQNDIARGVAVLKGMSDLDVGQSVVVQEGLVLGVEAIEGTDALIARCAGYKRKGRKGVLVKLCKAQQDRSLDLPTFGVKTIEHLVQAGFGGVALHAGESLFLNRVEALSLADRHGIFIVGIEAE